MTRILIPRGGAKIVSSVDWELYFGDVLSDHVICGFTLSVGAGTRDINVALGTARVLGLHLNNSASCTGAVACLAVCDTHSIYVRVDRDCMCIPTGWTFTSNTTDVTPTDSFKIGTATTDCTGTTASVTTCGTAKETGVAQGCVFPTDFVTDKLFWRTCTSTGFGNKLFKNIGTEAVPCFLVVGSAGGASFTPLCTHDDYVKTVSSCCATTQLELIENCVRKPVYAASSTKAAVVYVTSGNNVSSSLTFGDATTESRGQLGNTQFGCCGSIVNTYEQGVSAAIGCPTGDVEMVILNQCGCTTKATTVIGDAACWAGGAACFTSFTDDTVTCNFDNVGWRYVNCGGCACNHIRVVRINSSLTANTGSFCQDVCGCITTSANDMQNVTIERRYTTCLAFLDITAHFESNCEACPWIRFDVGACMKTTVGGVLLNLHACNTICMLKWQKACDLCCTWSDVGIRNVMCDTTCTDLNLTVPAGESARYWRMIADCESGVLALTKWIPHAGDLGGHSHSGTTDFTSV